jgi:hypothetical protein
MDRNALLAGVALGALLIFISDPDRGARRRALVRDKAIHGAHVSRRAIAATAADIVNRTRGTLANAWGAVRRDEFDEARLVERVRAALGRVCSHPRAIHLEAVDGEITIRGEVRASEVEDVLAAIGSVRGVEDVVDELDRYEDADGVLSIQGSGRVGEPSTDLFQHRWAPATRALVGMTAIAAAALSVAAYTRRAA